MNLRNENRKRLNFWPEFAADAMENFLAAGFSREEAVALISAVIGGKELVWSAPPGYIESGDYH